MSKERRMDGRGWAVRVPDGYRVGPWEIIGPIAGGAWSSVYDGRRVDADDRLPDRAALKFIATGTLTPRRLDHLGEMARRELRLYEALDHPRLMRLYETHVVDDPGDPHLDGAAVLVMERAVHSVGDLLRRGEPGPDAPRLLAEICEGLHHLHTSGWVHGDLKPSNILIMSDGSVRLADFGLAAEVDGTHAYLPPMGSSDFIAPERRAEPVGEYGAQVRQSADIWSLGVTAHLMLTGRYPFAGGTERARRAAAEAYAAGRGELTLSPDLSPDWRRLVADCLAPDHDRRRRHDTGRLLARVRRLAEAAVMGDGRRRRVRLAAMAVFAMAVLAGAASGLTAMTGGESPSGVADAADATGTTGTTGTAGDPGTTVAKADEARKYARYFRVDRDIPPRYHALIVRAGTWCEERGLSPLLIAAMLEAESGFDPKLRDPEMDEYGIARWTPRVLVYHLPPKRRDHAAEAAMRPEEAIPAMGRFFCRLGPELKDVPGDPALNLAATYRTSTTTVIEANGPPPRVRDYIERVKRNLKRYGPP